MPEHISALLWDQWHLRPDIRKPSVRSSGLLLRTSWKLSFCGTLRVYFSKSLNWCWGLISAFAKMVSSYRAGFVLPRTHCPVGAIWLSLWFLSIADGWVLWGGTEMVLLPCFYLLPLADRSGLMDLRGSWMVSEESWCKSVMSGLCEITYSLFPQLEQARLFIWSNTFKYVLF